MRTPEEFRSLAETLLASRAVGRENPAVEVIEEPAAQPREPEIAETNLLREVRLFRARITEAFEAAVERLSCDVACDVLARELQLAPVDIECIVDRALQRYFAEEPLRVRVHPDDVAALHCTVSVVADTHLSRGDAILELRDGFIDASLGVRLASVLREAAL